MEEVLFAANNEPARSVLRRLEGRGRSLRAPSR
jgi:hypothetical protein